MNYAYQEGFNEGYRKGYEEGMMALQERMVFNMSENTDDDYVEKSTVKDMENYSIKLVMNVEDAKEYKISEDISKGFEGFLK